MSYEYSENVLVQDSVGNLLENEFKWEVVYAYNKETLGISGTLGRSSYKEVVLTRYVKQAMFKFNSWLTDELCDDAIKIFLAILASNTLMQTNKQKYKIMKDGIKVDFKKEDGTIEVRNVKIFNFKEPLKNQFLAVKEMKIWGEIYHRRTDIVGFVNGIPLLFIELKRQSVNMKNAYDDNYCDYLDTIPQLFYFNAFIMLSNGLKSKVGTLGSKYEFFHEWKRIEEEEIGNVELETMLLGICKRENFMDLFENFVLYDESMGKIAKILARNHQYLGVNQAVEAYEHRKLNGGKLGVFWHTQGSGKSYSMVFLSEKIRRKFFGSPTFIVLTDRRELNKQISETYEACGCLGNTPAKGLKPKNGKALIEMLSANCSYIFTLIQKFNKDDLFEIKPDHDVIVMSDEAHRTQNGIFADNMRYILPNASYIGFTGTPLLKYDNITERTFGGYVSIYDFKRSVEDGSTVPIYYENRCDMLEIVNPEINDEILDVIENSELDDDQRASLERDLGRAYHIRTSNDRLSKIAKDFVNHYLEIWTTGKAMFVCLDKVTTVRMLEFAHKYWQENIKTLKEELQNTTQQEFIELKKKLKWMEETEMSVIISDSQNEIKIFANWGIDIKPYRKKMVNRELDKEFKDSENPFRIVFVCAMWLTGFDVKSLSVIYLDKPMKAHTLMQTIARANRVYEGKANGLVVDYANVLKALRKALAEYTVSRDGIPIPDITPSKKELIERIIELINIIKMFLLKLGFDINELIEAVNFEKMSLVQKGANAVCVKDQSKNKFEILARELFKLFKYVGKDDIDSDNRKHKNAVSEIYNLLHEKRDKPDISKVMVQLHQVVDKYITVKTDDAVLAQAKKFDISHIDFDRLRQEFQKVQNKNLLLKDIRDVVEQRLNQMMKKNPLRINYYKRYMKIIDDYNEEQDRAVIEKIFIDLMNVMNDLDEEEKRYAREGFECDEELTIYDLLLKVELKPNEIKKVKELAHKLLKTIKNQIAKLNNWRDKEETVSKVKVLIRDELWNELPESYEVSSISVYADEIYKYVYTTYPAA